MLSQLPEGVVVITGTNGKTTTTKMVVELFEATGKRVLTNRTGSNLNRGIISSLVHQASASGKLPYDIAVFELDEAYARRFVHTVKPRWVLALNVTRDQLDRFGEVDTAAAMIVETMQAATEGVVTNANDPRLLPAAQKIAKEQGIQLHLFSVADGLRKFFPTENELVSVEERLVTNKSVTADVSLAQFSGQEVTYTIDGKPFTTSVKLSGQHNFQNAAAALAYVHALAPNIRPVELITRLSKIEPAFGRGEIYKLKNSTTLRMVLVKNPAGFGQALASYLPTSAPVMIAINDNIADGRDMSWLWDVDFAPLQGHNIALISGKRAPDMALRLQYDLIKINAVAPDLETAINGFAKQPGEKLLFTTYTAMLWLHKRLQKGDL
jgi:UDP-N-acetylmuramyl tripeptide synthase